jgi:hypothetical protein
LLEARYYEPSSAKSILVTPRVEGGYIVVDDALAFPLDKLELSITGHAEDKIRVRCTEDGAVLLFSNSNILESLLQYGDRKLQSQCEVVQKRLKGRTSKEFRYWGSVIAICAVLLLGGAFGFNLFIDWATWHLDPKLEAGIGKAASKAEKWDAKSSQLERLNRIGGKLASQLESSTFPFSFHVKKDKEVNAAAFPGGIVEVNQGLLDVATDDELAGILGHEMGHVLHHDTLHKILRDLGAKGVIALIAGAGSEEQIADALSVAQKLDSVRFSRTQEADADIVGVDLALKAGYDGAGLIHFFERLEKITGREDKLLALLSDHPLDAERVESVRKEIARVKAAR